MQTDVDRDAQTHVFTWPRKDGTIKKKKNQVIRKSAAFSLVQNTSQSAIAIDKLELPFASFRPRHAGISPRCALCRCKK